MAKGIESPTQEAVGFESPTASQSSRYPVDMRLRKDGFSIHSRPKTGPTMWARLDGKIVTEAAAIRWCQENEAVGRHD